MKKLIFVSGLLAAANVQAADLFEPIDYHQHSTVFADDQKSHVKSHAAMTVRVDMSFLDQQYQAVQDSELSAANQQPVEFQVSLPDGSIEDIVINRANDNFGESYSLFGHVKGQPDYQVAFNTAEGTAFAGTIMLGERSYKITPKSDGISIVEPILGRKYACGGGKDSGLEYEHDFSSQLDSQFETADSVNATSNVDVMLIYTSAAKYGAGSESNIRALAQQSVDQMNLSLSNSQVDANITLVYTGEVAYTETGSGYTDLDWVTNNSGVASLRNQYGADLVGFLVENPGNLCGLGWYMANPSPNFASRGFQVTRRNCMGGWTVAHEFGHNMGLQHDEANAGGRLGPYQYNYGHILSNNYHTIMAYGSSCNWCPVINNLSNPDVSFRGVPTGTAYHNNARRLNDTRAIVAAFREGDDDGGDDPVEVIELEKGKSETLASLEAGKSQPYKIVIPNNDKNLTIRTSGGSGDVSLYVTYEGRADQNNHDCASESAGSNSETCSFADAQRGTYYIMLTAEETSGNVSIIADYGEDDGGDDYDYTESAYVYSRYSTIFPRNNYGYYYAKSGTHKAQLSSSSSNTDFDLYFQKWNGRQWVTVDSSYTPSNDETIEYNGSAGYYRWYVYSYSGSATATLQYNIPK